MAGFRCYDMLGRQVNCPTVGNNPGVANGNAPGYYLQTDENGNYAGGYMVTDQNTVAGATTGQIVDQWRTTVLEDGIFYYIVKGLSFAALGFCAWLFIKTLIKP